MKSKNPYMNVEELTKLAEEEVEWELENVSDVIDENYNKKDNKNDYLTLTTPFKLVICGPSNTGKTIALLNLIYKGHIYYDTLTIISDTAKEQTEKFSLLEDLAEIFPNKIKFYQKATQFKMKDYKNNKVNIVIIDDAQECTKKEEIENITNIFTKGRHNGISPIYLAQDFYKCPIRIRSNSSHYVFFKTTSKKSLNRMYLDVSADLDRDEWNALFEDATEPCQASNSYPFLVVDTTQREKCLRYRKCWKQIYKDEKLTSLLGE